MNRNWYAVVTLALLALLVGCSGLYVHTTADRLRQDAADAYACSLAQDYTGARQGFADLEAQMKRHGLWLRLVVRRALVDKVEETVATLPHYASPDNQADLAVEAARVQALIDQMESSFFGGS